jgi:folate-binding protein YgfZ
MIEALERHLKGFDLRREFQFKKMKDLAVETNENAPFSYQIALNSTNAAAFPNWNWERVVRRGLAQVPSDLQPGVSFPFDAGADLIGAVSWDKGCYLGQELVARASRLGSVRRRLFPFEGSQAEVGQVLFDSEGAEVGKIISVYRREGNDQERLDERTKNLGEEETKNLNHTEGKDQNHSQRSDQNHSNPHFDSSANSTSNVSSLSDHSPNHTPFFGFALINTTIQNLNLKSFKIHNPLGASALLKNIDNQ